MFARTIGGRSRWSARRLLTASLLSDSSIPPGAADQLLGPAHGAGLDPAVIQSLAVSLQSGLATVFWAIAGIAVAAALTTLFFPEIPIRTTTPADAGVGEPAPGMSTLPPEA
jgi:hypothetical protein